MWTRFVVVVATIATIGMLGCGANSISPLAPDKVTANTVSVEPSETRIAATKPVAASLAKIAGTTVFKGKTYYVDVAPSGNKAEVWLRQRRDACLKGDIKMVDLRFMKTTLKQAGEIACRYKEVYDNGKTILGCAASVATGVCAVASVPSGGAAAALCSASIVYTFDRGVADCIDGISKLIASKLVGEKEWAVVATQVNVQNGRWSSAIDSAIDLACADLRSKR